MEFIMENFVVTMVIASLCLFAIIGFMVDVSKSKKLKEDSANLQALEAEAGESLAPKPLQQVVAEASDPVEKAPAKEDIFVPAEPKEAEAPIEELTPPTEVLKDNK